MSEEGKNLLEDEYINGTDLNDGEDTPEFLEFLKELDKLNEEFTGRPPESEVPQIDIPEGTNNQPAEELSTEEATSFLEGAAEQNNLPEKVPTMKRWLSFIQEKLRALKDKIFGNSKDDR